MTCDALDVVIPARGEGERIAPCLRALLDDADGLSLRVIVALNGEDAAKTEAVLATFADAFAARGHELIATRSDPGKARALNAGDRLRRGGPVVYLDADVELQPGALRELADVLGDERAPRLACPRLQAALGASLANRAFVRVWSQRPIIRDGVMGGGCYAVNAAGRRLWGEFPDIAGDDAFVCGLFPPEQRTPLSSAALIRLPERWRELVATKARWRRSAREGAVAALALRAAREGVAPRPYPPHVGASRWPALPSPRLFGSALLYAAMDVAARLTNAFAGGRAAPDWRPLRR